MKKIVSVLLILSLFIFALEVPVMAEEYDVDSIYNDNQYDSTSEELEYQGDIENNYTVQPMLALPYPIYFIPGIGQAALIGTGAVIVGGITFKASSWIAKTVNSFLKAETADQIISKNKKGSIRKVFPGEYLNKTLNEIEKDAKAGKARAKTAKKLLTEKRFDK